jgi:hypothetical protein
MQLDANLLPVNDDKLIHETFVKKSGPEFLPGDFARGT